MYKKKYLYLFLLTLIIAVGAFLRIRLSQDPYLHKWDERFHALVAKNLMQHPLQPTLYNKAILHYDYTAWYSNHIWLHKQPLPLWMIATTYKIAGISEFATRIPSILFSVLSIYLLYVLGKYLFGKRTGLMASFFLSINGLVVEMCSGRIATDHYDTLFLVFILMAILFAYYHSATNLKRYIIFSGVFIGFAILTKWLPALIVLPVHFFLLLRAGKLPKETVKPLLISLVTAAFICLPWQFYILWNYPLEAKWEYYHNWLHITSELDEQTGGYFYFLEKIRINYSEIIYLPMVYMIYRIYKTHFKDYTLMAIFIWIIVPLIFFSLAKTKMQGYILFICPALFLITAHFYFKLLAFIKAGTPSVLLKILSLLILAAIIFLPLRYCFERTSFGYGKSASQPTANYKTVKGDIPANSVVINVKNPVEFMFYHNCIAYTDTVLKASDMNQLKTLQYTLFVYDETQNKVVVTAY